MDGSDAFSLGGAEGARDLFAHRAFGGQRGDLNHVIGDFRRSSDGTQQIVSADDHTCEIQHAGAEAHPVPRDRRVDHVEERLGGEMTGVGERQLHHTLDDAGDPQGDYVEHEARNRQPEMDLDQAGRPQLRLPQARNQPVENGEDHQADPADGTIVDMADRPIGIVRQRIDVAQREHAALEGGDGVAGDAAQPEPDDRILAHRYIIAAFAEDGHVAVERTTPAGNDQHQREHHAECLRPFGGAGVQQVVGASPDVDEDQRPEVQDRQLVTVDRLAGGLRQEVV